MNVDKDHLQLIKDHAIQHHHVVACCEQTIRAMSQISILQMGVNRMGTSNPFREMALSMTFYGLADLPLMHARS